MIAVVLIQIPCCVPEQLAIDCIVCMARIENSLYPGRRYACPGLLMFRPYGAGDYQASCCTACQQLNICPPVLGGLAERRSAGGKNVRDVRTIIVQ
jgi:hypothetical protein